MWWEVAPRIATLGYRVIAPDLPHWSDRDCEIEAEAAEQLDVATGLRVASGHAGNTVWRGRVAEFLAVLDGWL